MDVVFIQIANIAFCFQGYTCILFNVFSEKGAVYYIFFPFILLVSSLFTQLSMLLISSLEEKLIFSLKAQG